MKKLNSYIVESLKVQNMNLIGKNFKVTVGDLKDVCNAINNDNTFYLHGDSYVYHWEIPGTWKNSQKKLHYKKQNIFGLRIEFDTNKRLSFNKKSLFIPENIISIKFVITNSDGWSEFNNEELIDTVKIPIAINY